MAKNNSLPRKPEPAEFPDNGQNQAQEPDGGELAARLAKSEAALTEKGSRVFELEQVLAERDEQINTLKQSLAELETKLAELADSRSQVLASYRALVVSSNPDLPEELIAGDSVEEIDKSLASARALIDRVRERLEMEIAGARIPAGAPLRAPLDLSALSPQEKIQYAMGERR
jgi:uncharacterized coiled-coil protein SlyX